MISSNYMPDENSYEGTIAITRSNFIYIDSNQYVTASPLCQESCHPWTWWILGVRVKTILT